MWHLRGSWGGPGRPDTRLRKEKQEHVGGSRVCGAGAGVSRCLLSPPLRPFVISEGLWKSRESSRDSR